MDMLELVGWQEVGRHCSFCLTNDVKASSLFFTWSTNQTQEAVCTRKKTLRLKKGIVAEKRFRVPKALCVCMFDTLENRDRAWTLIVRQKKQCTTKFEAIQSDESLSPLDLFVYMCFPDAGFVFTGFVLLLVLLFSLFSYHTNSQSYG